MKNDCLPYKCQQVLELYGAQGAEIDQLESLKKTFAKLGILAEMYYTNRRNLSYSTLVVFLPWNFHAELSKFDMKAFKKWHLKKARG